MKLAPLALLATFATGAVAQEPTGTVPPLVIPTVTPRPRPASSPSVVTPSVAPRSQAADPPPAVTPAVAAHTSSGDTPSTTTPAVAATAVATRPHSTGTPSPDTPAVALHPNSADTPTATVPSAVTPSIATRPPAAALAAPGTPLIAERTIATLFTDPANLRGERIKPRDGRELPIDQGTLGLQQMLRRLNTRASILNIVAHPDDEDGGMLTFYARGLGARVVDLSLTRGEGGQNAVTGDFEDALGLLRTQELLANDRYTGVDQFFGTEVDFGFSKTKEEAFAKWTHQRVLYDAVRAVRLYRPLVITSTWVGGVTDGHGQHQVSGEIAQEVFKAAGDPKVFPELTAEGILPWQPLKVYARVPRQAITEKGLFDYATGQYTPARFTNYVTGEISTTPPEPNVVVHEGQTDPLLTVASANPADLPNSMAQTTGALTYMQFARIGLSRQKSQLDSNMRAIPAGTFDVSYHRFGSMLPKAQQKAQEDTFFDGIDTSVASMANLARNPPAALRAGIVRLSDALAAISASFLPKDPQASAPGLADALDQASHLMAMTDSIRELSPVEKASILHEIRVKRAQINDALVLALGLTFDVTSLDADLNAGSAVKLSSTLKTTASINVAVEDIHAETSPGGFTQPEDEKGTERVLTADHADRRTLTLSGEETGNVTRPYFTRDNIEQPAYQLRVLAFQGAPATPPAIVAWANINYLGVRISLGSVVHNGNQPAQFVPPLSLALSSRAQVVPLGEKTFGLEATVRSTASAPPVAKLHLYAPPKWEVKPNMEPMEVGTTRFEVTPPKHRPTETVELFSSIIQPAAPTVKEGYRAVGYGDLPRTNYYTPAIDRVVPVDLKVPEHHKIAYLPGTGDAVPEALASIGLKPDVLTVADVNSSKLKQYDTIILGVRTYAAHADLHGAPTQALLDYAKGGGNVVVQYQTTEFTAADAPYPLSLGSNEKVVDETAAVQLTADPNGAGAHLLALPNKIMPDDFKGWVEERGHGFLSTWDAHYSAPTETHDPGQEPQKGGLITTQLGKGRWTYVAFALYRQLPEAVPGAYRLFLNLLNP